MLAALGRLSPGVREGDPLLERLLAIVPTGVPDEPPPRAGSGTVPAHPAFEPGRQVLLWNGGIWDWMDAPTLVTAFARVLERHPGARLLFLGTGHPNPDVPAMGACSAARELAGRLGLLDRTVFFGGWAPYAERHRWLQAATLGVSLHREHLEARFAWRSRLLDNLWCGLPALLSAGDALGERMAAAGAAVSVRPGDVPGVEAALGGLLEEPERLQTMRAAAQELAPALRWSRLLAPLERFLAEPRLTRDRGRPLRHVDYLKEFLPHSPLHGALPARLGRVLEREGWTGLVRRTWGRLSGRRGKPGR
jgi:glycosyltransferase involved in cell wall biosynthesis